MNSFFKCLVLINSLVTIINFHTKLPGMVVINFLLVFIKFWLQFMASQSKENFFLESD